MHITKEWLQQLENYYRKQDNFWKMSCIDFMKHILIAYSRRNKKGVIILLDKEFEVYYWNFATLFSINKLIDFSRTDKESHYSIYSTRTKRYHDYEWHQYIIKFRIINSIGMLDVLDRFSYLLNIANNDITLKAYNIWEGKKEICIKKTLKWYEIDKLNDDLWFSKDYLTQDKAVKLFEILLSKWRGNIKTKDILKRKTLFKKEWELHTNIRRIRDFLWEWSKDKTKDFNYLVTWKDWNEYTYSLVNLKSVDLTT